jgi:uncharacterized membrane protein YcaP (DUF421 family)
MDIVLRAIVVFVFLLFLMRIVGRRELSSLEPFDLVLLIVIGDLVQQGVTQSDHSLTGAILSAGTFGVLVVAVSYASFRFRRLRPVVEGEPMVVVQDGRPIEGNLRRERITLEELAASARKQQIASLEEVEWAVLETSGQVSFIRKTRTGS